MKLMKSKLISIPILSSLCLLGVSSHSFAQTDSENVNVQELAEKLQKITKEATKLQEEMKMLRAELKRMKKEAAETKKESELAEAKPKPSDTTLVAQKGNVSEVDSVLSKFSKWPTVTTSPYIGLQSTYDGSDLVVNVSSMAEDLRLLRQRQALATKLGGDLAVFENRPVILISGKLEPTVGARRLADERNHRSDIDLDTSELDFLIEASSNAFGFMSLAYDNRPLDKALIGSPVGRRISNSNIYLKRGFITLGNLDKFPLYLSAGQMYTDFGRYTSNFIASPLPTKIGRTNARQIHLGYVSPFGLSASTYVFKGDTHTGNSNKINEGGFNLRFKKDFENTGVEFGGGYITNLADSENMQATGLSSPRAGFGFTQEFIYHRVPGANAYGELRLGPWKFVSEYVTATRAFDWRNVTFGNGYVTVIHPSFHPLDWRNVAFNAVGAKPRALQLEFSRKFDLLGKPSLVGLAFNRSSKAYAFGLPRESYGIVFSTFPIKNVRFTLEYRYNKEYPANTTGYINGTRFPLLPKEFVASSFPALVEAARLARSKGGHNRGVLAQLSLYF